MNEIRQNAWREFLVMLERFSPDKGREMREGAERNGTVANAIRFIVGRVAEDAYSTGYSAGLEWMHPELRKE